MSNKEFLSAQVLVKCPRKIYQDTTRLNESKGNYLIHILMEITQNF